MKSFIEYVVKALVDYPDEVEIREIDSERSVVFELRLNPTDIGKVIGRSGRTITAIRSLLTSAAAKQGKRAIVEIIEPDREPPPETPVEAESEAADGSEEAAAVDGI